MKKLTKLDKVYEDINQTYGGATEEQMQDTIQDLQKEIQTWQKNKKKSKGKRFH